MRFDGKYLNHGFVVFVCGGLFVFLFEKEEKMPWRNVDFVTCQFLFTCAFITFRILGVKMEMCEMDV